MPEQLRRVEHWPLVRKYFLRRLIIPWISSETNENIDFSNFVNPLEKCTKFQFESASIELYNILSDTIHFILDYHESMSRNSQCLVFEYSIPQKSLSKLFLG